MRNLRRAGWLLLFGSTALGAAEFLPGGNSGALARNFALPALGQPAVLKGGRHVTGAHLDITNEFVTEGFASDGSCPVAECVLLDGETTRLLLSHRRGLGGGWDLRAEVPLLAQGGGVLDGWIEGWHEGFGLPDGARETQPRGQYRYRYVRGGSTALDVRDTYSGFGDFNVTLGRRLGDSLALRAMFKLPTGDAERLGGGNPGGALWLNGALPLPGRSEGFLAAGVSVNERGTVLPAMQNRQVFFGGIGLSLPVPFTRRARLLAQLYGHGRLYEGSELSPFDRPAFPLTVGLRLPLGKGKRLDLGFQEDLGVNASPDFSAYLALNFTPQSSKSKTSASVAATRSSFASF